MDNWPRADETIHCIGDFLKTSKEQPGLKTMSYFTYSYQWEYRLQGGHLLTIIQVSSGKIRTQTRLSKLQNSFHCMWYRNSSHIIRCLNAWSYFQSCGCSYLKICLADWSATLTDQLLQASGTETLVSFRSWGRGIFPSVPRKIAWSFISKVKRRRRCTEMNHAF